MYVPPPPTASTTSRYSFMWCFKQDIREKQRLEQQRGGTSLLLVVVVGGVNSHIHTHTYGDA